MNLASIVTRVQPAAASFQNNTLVKSIMSAFMSALPVLLAGAVFSLFKTFPNDAYTTWLESIGLDTILQAGIDATTNMIALYVVLAVGYFLGKELGKDPWMSAVIALLGFLLVTPFTTTATDAEENVITVGSVLPIAWLGSKGIFTALIIGVAVTYANSFILDRNLKIRMPDSVPPNVSRPFEAALPAFMISVVLLGVRMGFEATSYDSFGNFVYQMLGKPLTGLGNTYLAWFVCLLVINVLWLIGVHGTIVVLSVMLAIWTGPMLENQAAASAGDALPYLLTGTFGFAILQWLGGPGNLIGLAANMAIFARSERYKALGRLAFLPACFNIIEPIVFGFPLVLNPIMAIPFVLTPLITFSIGYGLLSTGLIGVPVIPLPTSAFTMPFIPGGFLLGAGIAFGIYMIVMALLSAVIYYPFFRYADRQELAAERAAKEKKEAEAQATASAAAPGTTSGEDLAVGGAAPA